MKKEITLIATSLSPPRTPFLLGLRDESKVLQSGELSVPTLEAGERGVVALRSKTNIENELSTGFALVLLGNILQGFEVGGSVRGEVEAQGCSSKVE